VSEGLNALPEDDPVERRSARSDRG
jgi:hypothetical protein